MEAISLHELTAGIGSLSYDAQVLSVITDSRKAEAGCVFVAIRGERVDGHAFVPEVLEKGAVLAVVEHPVAGAPAERQLVVKNTLNALISMGGNYRRRYQPVLVGVTGSVGKTTTKEFVYAILSAFGPTLKTQGNKNNEIGMPETLFNLTDEYQYAVVEMAMSAPGDISLLTNAAKPHTAIITGIGVSHIEALGSRENILKAKLEICEGLAQEAVLVLNGDDELLCGAAVREDLKKVFFALENKEADVVALDVTEDGNGERFTIQDKAYGSFAAHIPALGRHSVCDALAAYTVATRMGLPAAECAKALERYTPAGQRQKIVDFRGITVIEDCYNASPDSMRAALTTLASLQNKGKKIAVLGDMLELGPISVAMHERVGEVAAENNVSAVYTFGEKGAIISAKAMESGVLETGHFTDKEALVRQLKRVVRTGDAVLFKASRGMKFEEIISAFYEG